MNVCIDDRGGVGAMRGRGGHTRVIVSVAVGVRDRVGGWDRIEGREEQEQGRVMGAESGTESGTESGAGTELSQ